MFSAALCLFDVRDDSALHRAQVTIGPRGRGVRQPTRGAVNTGLGDRYKESRSVTDRSSGRQAIQSGAGSCSRARLEDSKQGLGDLHQSMDPSSVGSLRFTVDHVQLRRSNRRPTVPEGRLRVNRGMLRVIGSWKFRENPTFSYWALPGTDFQFTLPPPLFGHANAHRHREPVAYFT
jgi:hypothetical protein